MHEHTYDIVLQTSIGAKNGTMTLRISKDKVDGFMNILGKTEPCYGKIDEKGICKLNGRMITLMREFDYTATGYLGNDGLNLILCGGQDVFQVTGVASTKAASI